MLVNIIANIINGILMEAGPPPPSETDILSEAGDNILSETGDQLITE